MGTLPFGGRRESGFGRIHGDEGIKEFVWSKATAQELLTVPGFAMVFDDPKKKLELTRQTIQGVFGGSALDNVGAVLRKLGL